MRAHSPAAAQAKGDVPASVIAFDGVSVTFRTQKSKDVTALADFTLSVRSREILALVGPSGCGKSTALRLLAGLIKPSSGTVRVDSAAERRGFEEVAFVFQRPTLLPWLTVLQNVLYPVRILGRRVGPAERDRARELLAMVGLAEVAMHMPDELSGGMQQRAAICRSLVLDPKILLMDEPFGALDALTREELQLDLLRLHQATHKTILLVTHSISEAVLVADRVAVMSTRPGRVEDLVDVPLARPRGPEIQADPAFAHCAQRIRNGIFGYRRKEGDSS
jgi:NitT/TauT family transport system ATP-binding protein